VTRIKPQEVYFFAGGGTGGHLYPALAVAHRLLEKQPDCDIHFIGTSRGLEARVVPEQGFPLHLISVSGFARKRFWANLLAPFRLLVSLAQCARLVRKYRPSVAVGTGGYVSGPMILVAHLFGAATLIQEQNSYPGVTTRLLARWVDQVHVAFADTLKYFRHPDRVHLTGNPVRNLQVTESPEQARAHFQLHPDRLTLLVFGGSQGAHVINTAMIKALPMLLEQTPIQILWATGKWDLREVTQAAAADLRRVRVFEYLSEMPLAYRAADLAVCRAGALTLAELAQCGLPAVLIPFARAAANHQERNALALQKEQAAAVILEKELNERILLQEIMTLVHNAEARSRISQAIRGTAFPHATDELTQAILMLRKQKGDIR